MYFKRLCIFTKVGRIVLLNKSDDKTNENYRKENSMKVWKKSNGSDDILNKIGSSRTGVPSLLLNLPLLEHAFHALV